MTQDEYKNILFPKGGDGEKLRKLGIQSPDLTNMHKWSPKRSTVFYFRTKEKMDSFKKRYKFLNM